MMCDEELEGGGGVTVEKQVGARLQKAVNGQ